MSTEDSTATQFDETRPVLYLNVIIEDPSEAVKAGVSLKVQESSLPPPLKKRIAERVGNFAADMVTASKAAEKAAPGMCEEMPQKMKEKGLTVHCEPVFQEGPYFVVSMQVLHADVQLMMDAEKQAGQEEGFVARTVKWILKAAGVDVVDKVQRDYLPGMIQAQMQPKLDEMMAQQMYEEKKMKGSVDVLPEEKQARYFYAMLKAIRAAEAAAKASKGPSLPPNPFKKNDTKKTEEEQKKGPSLPPNPFRKK